MQIAIVHSRTQIGIKKHVHVKCEIRQNASQFKALWDDTKVQHKEVHPCTHWSHAVNLYRICYSFGWIVAVINVKLSLKNYR